jgi:integrase
VQQLHEKDLAESFGQVALPDALERKYPEAARQWGRKHVSPAAKRSVDPRTGAVRRHHLSEKGIQRIQSALRQCCAMPLLMNGVNIREVQDLLGHKNIKTTMMYTHVMQNMATASKNPIDTLESSVYAFEISGAGGETRTLKGARPGGF